MREKNMQQNRRLIAVLLAVLLLLCLSLLLSAHLHESRHHDDDCLLCAFARAWRWEMPVSAVSAVWFSVAALCRTCRVIRCSGPRVSDTLTDQKVLLLS